MLSRVAESLYWLGRYLERADNIARLLEASIEMMQDLDLETMEQVRSDWSPLAECLGLADFQPGNAQQKDRDSILEYLIFSQENQSSIVNCIRFARENARGMREQISAEMWEHLNHYYLWSRNTAGREWFAKSSFDFLEHIRNQSALFHGIAHGSMPRNNGWDFLQAGIFIERAEKSTRFLDDELHLLSRVAQRDLTQWNAVLKSCSARQAYQQKYMAGVQRRLVAELLLLDARFPRSVRFCVTRADHSLRLISGAPPFSFSNTAEQASGLLLARLSYGTVDEHLSPSLHQSMDRLQCEINDLHGAVHSFYFNQQNAAPMPETDMWQHAASQ